LCGFIGHRNLQRVVGIRGYAFEGVGPVRSDGDARNHVAGGIEKRCESPARIDSRTVDRSIGQAIGIGEQRPRNRDGTSNSGSGHGCCNVGYKGVRSKRFEGRALNRHGVEHSSSGWAFVDRCLETHLWSGTVGGRPSDRYVVIGRTVQNSV